MESSGVIFLGLLCFTYLFAVGSKPIYFIKKLANVHNESESKNLALMVIKELVNCCLCSGFWIGLIYYQDLLSASVVAIGSELFYRVYNLIISKI